MTPARAVPPNIDGDEDRDDGDRVRYDDDYDPQHTSDRLDAVQPGSETSGIHARCRSRMIRGHGLESGAPTWAGRLSRRVALTPGTRPDILLALIVAEC